MDTASALAILQEEEINTTKTKPPGRPFVRNFDRSTSEKSVAEKTEARTQRTEAEEKLAKLKNHRRKNGLCFKCGGKWSTTHTCPDSVPLHVLEELWDAVDLANSDDVDTEQTDTMTVEDSVFSVQTTDRSKKGRHQTLKLLARIGKHQVLVLVDSGSIGTFISEHLVQTLGLQTNACQTATFKAADGGQLHCDKQVASLQWGVQGHKFISNARVLALQCYDMIVGEDWLEAVSPVWVDYKTKEMRITVKNRRVTLQGIKDSQSACQPIGSKKLMKLSQHGGIMACLQIGSEENLERASEEVQAICAIQDTESDSVPDMVQQLLLRNEHLFRTPSELPPSREADHHIKLMPGAQPISVRPYHYSPIQKNEIEAQVHSMLKSGVIRPSNSQFASPVLLVKKKDGTWRFCVDYRHLNAITLKHKHPMPIVDELLDEINGAQWFTKLDFSAGYHQIRMAAGDEYKTAFRTHQGLYEFMVMPFGLTNAPATFQSLMNVIFAELLRKGVLVFMDDILVYSKTLEEHLELLKKVFRILEKHQFLIKKSKCKFAQKTVDYLGHVISAAGVATDPSKVQAVKNWPTPKNLKQLRGFLGLTGYYRKFIQHYGLLARPMTELLKKGTLFQWTPQTEQSFQLLKQRLIEAPVLAVPDFDQQFVVETDASDCGIGAVLMQSGHPIAYLSKHLCPRNQTLSVYEKECMAILLAIQRWRPYLQHRKFLIRTDHKSLLHLTEQRITSKIQHKALVKLMDLDYNIQYKKGINNAAADALSRCETGQELCAISECVPSWIQKLTEGYEDSPNDKQLLAELSLTGENEKGFSLVEGVIRFKGRIWVGSNLMAQKHILQALHDSGLGGHSGIAATYNRIKALFA